MSPSDSEQAASVSGFTPETIAARLASDLPTPDFRHTALEALAAAIPVAHKNNPAGWVAYLSNGRTLRFNVGWLIGLHAKRESVRIVLPQDAAAALSSRMTGGVLEKKPFRSEPDLTLATMLPAEFVTLWPELRVPFLEAVGKAARRRTNFSRRYQPAMLEVISKESGVALPTPDYNFRSAPSTRGRATEAEGLTEERANQLLELFDEFLSAYHFTDQGTQHYAAYARSRETGLANLESVLAAKARGEDVADLVLLKLLPNPATARSLEAGAWTSIAGPSFKTDLKTWYEANGWAKPADWPSVADALLRLYQRCKEYPEDIEAACDEFVEACPAKGFQTGTVSPMLNCIDPEEFAIVNNKSRWLVNFFLNTRLRQSLDDYPETNARLQELADVLNERIRERAPGTNALDLVDEMSHWVVTTKKEDLEATRGRRRGRTSGDATEEGASEVREGTTRSSKTYLDEPERFNPEAFRLLDQLHENPTRKFYNTISDALEREVEAPLKALLRRVVALLPAKLLSLLETEKRLFSRFQKNDYGRGGVWDFYWSALYPKGGRRQTDMQLYMSAMRTQLEYGFSFGDSSGDPKQRLVNGLSRLPDSLIEDLDELCTRVGAIYGPRVLLEGGGAPAAASGVPRNFREWCHSAADGYPSIRIAIPAAEVSNHTLDSLARSIADFYSGLTPLVLLATSQNPEAEARALLEGDDDEPEDQVAPYSLEQLSQDSGIRVGQLDSWVRGIERKGQMILYGPPGTGKTFLAGLLSRHLAGGMDGFANLVQFHPAYAYEDFMQGIRPRVAPGGALTFDLARGRFLEFCEKAATRKGRCVLIVDEINRANLARVFGELMYLLEYRDQEIPLAAGGSLRVPSNVRLIGTMNTADRSIALVDHALRRRFAFVPLHPDYDVLKGYHERHGNGFPVDDLVRLLKDLNADISDPHYEVGITFFLHPQLGEQIADIWRMEIEPYLEEYFFDRASKVADYRWDKVEERLQL